MPADTRRRPGLLWDSEGIGLVLLGSEIQEVVRIRVHYEPHEDDDGKGHESNAVVDRCEEREEEHPEGCVVDEPHEPKRLRESLFDRYIIRCVLAEPCEPHGRVILDDQSEERPKDCEADQSTPFHPQCGGEGSDDVDQGRNPEAK